LQISGNFFRQALKINKSKKFFFEKKNQKTFLLRFARC